MDHLGIPNPWGRPVMTSDTTNCFGRSVRRADPDHLPDRCDDVPRVACSTCYNLGVIAGAILFIVEDFGLSATMKETAISASLFGAMFGALAGGKLGRLWIGRRNTIVAGAVLGIGRRSGRRRIHGHLAGDPPPWWQTSTFFLRYAGLRHPRCISSPKSRRTI